MSPPKKCSLTLHSIVPHNKKLCFSIEMAN
jgi:hypothetical protein